MSQAQPEPVAETAPPAPRPNLLRRMYDWVLSWADTPYGAVALFLLAFAESSFFPVPPDVLLMALCIGSATKSMRFALICSLGSVLGGLLGYTIGWLFWDQTQSFFFNHVPGFSEDKFNAFQSGYERNGFLIVFTAGFSPIPYKVFTIASGVFGDGWRFLPQFLFASAVSRSARFFLVAALIQRFGEGIKDKIDKYFNWFALAFVALLALGFAAVKYMH